MTLNKGMIPLNQRTPEEVRAITRKGGLSRSPKKSMARKISWLKRKGYVTSKDREWFLARILDPEADIIYLQELTYRLQKSLPETELKDVIDLGIKLHKAKFGEKHKVLSINVEVTPEQLTARNEELDEQINKLMGDEIK